MSDECRALNEKPEKQPKCFVFLLIILHSSFCIHHFLLIRCRFAVFTAACWSGGGGGGGSGGGGGGGGRPGDSLVIFTVQ